MEEGLLRFINFDWLRQSVTHSVFYWLFYCFESKTFKLVLKFRKSEIQKVEDFSLVYKDALFS